MFEGRMGQDAAEWQPENPFAERERKPVDAQPAAASSAPAAPTVSPFMFEYDLYNAESDVDPEAEAFAELLDELHDPEMDVAVYELVGEASELIAPVAEEEISDGLGESRRAQLLSEYFAPLVRRTEELVDEVDRVLAPVDLETTTDAELERLFETVEPTPAASSPAFEGFLRKAFKKIKGVVRGGVRLVKKGINAVKNFALRPLLKALKKLVRPLIAKVAKLALSKVPAKLRPFLLKLVGKAVPGVSELAEVDADSELDPNEAEGFELEDLEGASTGVSSLAMEQAAPDVTLLQRQFDLQLLELAMAGSAEELEAVAHAATEATQGGGDPVTELERARRRFIRRIQDLPQDGDPAPAVEEFIPAVLAALRVGIRIIGRQRVVGWLGKLIGFLIRPLAGPQVAKILGNVVADVGMRTFLQMELAPEQSREAAGRMIAHTVEETVRRIAKLPPEVLDEETVFEAHVLEAFESAAAANFPGSLVREDLRESEAEGVWLATPGSAGRYLKFSRAFDTVLTPAVTSAVPIFGASTLHAFLRDQLRRSVVTPLNARVHLFRLLPGGRLIDIARSEPLRGLGREAPGGWQQLHPFTPEAATALIREPRLGRAVASDAEALRPTLDGRFYFLELSEATARPVQRASHIRVKLDLVRHEARVCLFLAEPVAQEVAAQIRQRATAASVIGKVRGVYAHQLRIMTGPGSRRLVRIVVGRPKQRPLPSRSMRSVHDAAGRARLRTRFGSKVLDWCWSRLGEWLQRSAPELAAAATDPAEGVTIRVVFQNPPGLRDLRTALRGGSPSALKGWPPREVPAAAVRVTAGHPHA